MASQDTSTECTTGHCSSGDNSSETFQIFLRTLEGKTITLQVDKFEQIETLKQKIEAREGIPGDEQRLVYGGKDLMYGHTIADYNIVRDTTIDLVLRVLGCPVDCQCGFEPYRIS